MKHLLIGILLCLFGIASFAQANFENRTIMTYRAEFDTLRNVGYDYVFGTDNPSEYNNDIDFGTLVFTDSQVGIVTDCIYETYFENSIIKSVSLTTDDKNSSAELFQYVTIIYPDLPGFVSSDGEFQFTCNTVLNSMPVKIKYSQDRKAKNAVLLVSLDETVLK